MSAWHTEASTKHEYAIGVIVSGIWGQNGYHNEERTIL
jgi:hypothetical protein